MSVESRQVLMVNETKIRIGRIKSLYISEYNDNFTLKIKRVERVSRVNPNLTHLNCVINGLTVHRHRDYPSSYNSLIYIHIRIYMTGPEIHIHRATVV